MIQASTNTVHIYWYTSLRKAPSPSHHPRAYGSARKVPTPTTTSAPQRILRDVGIRRHPSSVHSSFPVRRARARHLSCLAAPAALGWYTSTVTSNPSMHGSRCSASYGLEAPTYLAHLPLPLHVRGPFVFWMLRTARPFIWSGSQLVPRSPFCSPLLFPCVLHAIKGVHSPAFNGLGARLGARMIQASNNIAPNCWFNTSLRKAAPPPLHHPRAYLLEGITVRRKKCPIEYYAP